MPYERLTSTGEGAVRSTCNGQHRLEERRYDVAEQVGGVRDHLANERTQLAWLRTGANVMVVGLAVARFADDGSITIASLLAGGLLIVAGALAVAYGTHRYRRLAEELRHGTSLSASSSNGPVIAAAVLVAAMVGATVILLLSA